MIGAALETIYSCHLGIFLSFAQGDISYAKLMRNTPSPDTTDPYEKYFCMRTFMKGRRDEVTTCWFPPCIAPDGVIDQFLTYLQMLHRKDTLLFRQLGFQNEQHLRAAFLGFFLEYSRQSYVDLCFLWIV